MRSANDLRLNPSISLFDNTFLTVVFGAVVIAIAAQLSIPLKPVPLTFQSSTIIFLGMLMGARKGFLTVLTYLALGFCGLPIFANFSFGLPAFLSPSGGYLIGFLPAVAIAGCLAEYGFRKNFISVLIASVLSALVIFISGIAYLANFIGLHQAIALGFYPFMLTEIIKLSLIAIFIPRIFKQR